MKPVRPEPEKPATSRSPDHAASDAVKRVARVYERRSAKRGKSYHVRRARIDATQRRGER